MKPAKLTSLEKRLMHALQLYVRGHEVETKLARYLAERAKRKKKAAKI
jgi:hypothetical protein